MTSNRPRPRIPLKYIFFLAILTGLFTTLITAATEWVFPEAQTAVVEHIGKGARGVSIESLFYDVAGYEAAESALQTAEQITDDWPEGGICDILFDGNAPPPSGNEPSIIIAYWESHPELCKGLIINNGFDYAAMRIMTVSEREQFDIDEDAIESSISTLKIVEVLYNWPNLASAGGKLRLGTTDTTPCEAGEYYQLADLGSFNNKTESAKVKNGCETGELFDFVGYGQPFFSYVNFANTIGALRNQVESTKIWP